jgi:PAS domain S-box-containing protein
MTTRQSAAEELGEMGAWQCDLRTGGTVWSPGMYRILGLEPQSSALSDEALLDHVHPDDRARIAALLAGIEHAPEALADDRPIVEFRVLRQDGSIRDIRARGHFERDAHGRRIRWVGSVQDVTDLRIVERSLSVHHGVGRALTEWGEFEEGVVDLLRRTGTALGYCVGSLWTRDAESERLTCRAFWNASGIDAGEFEAVTRRMSFAPGEGIPGHAWSLQSPIAIEDLDGEPRFARSNQAGRLGLRSALAIPAVGRSGPLAVLTFYSLDRRPVNELLNRTLAQIGSQLGRFLAPRLTDLRPQRLTPRELEVLNLAAEGNTGPQIAEQLIVSPGTVKTHFEHIYEKLGVGDRAAAVALGLRSGLIQ